MRCHYGQRFGSEKYISILGRVWIRGELCVSCWYEKCVMDTEEVTMEGLNREREAGGDRGLEGKEGRKKERRKEGKKGRRSRDVADQGQRHAIMRRPYLPSTTQTYRGGRHTVHTYIYLIWG